MGGCRAYCKHWRKVTKVTNPISEFTFLSTAKSGKSKIKNPFLYSPKGTHPKMLQTADSCGFKTLVDACDIVYRILPTLKSQQYIIYSPLTIDFSSCNLIPTEHVSEFVAVKTVGGGNCCLRAASLLLFGTEQYHLELRVRTIVELAKYNFYYLADSEVISRMEAEMAILNGKAVPG